MKHKEIKTSTGLIVRRVSRWLRVQYKDVTQRHSLYDYADNGCLTFFKFRGRFHAIGQFMRFDYGPSSSADVLPKFIDGGEEHSICAYDSTEFYSPMLIELSKDGEYVRVYEEC